METEAATPETAPVEAPSSEDALQAFLNEDDTPQEANSELGDAEQAPATDEDAQEAEAETEEGPPEEQPVYKVKVRGEEVEVPLDELLKGYSRTEDYKAKTAEVAEQRRNIEVQVATEYADKLEQATALFVQMDPVLQYAQTVDWTALAQTDPAQYVSLKAQVDQRNAVLANASREIMAAREQQSAAMAAAEQQELAQEREALFTAIPELRDETKFQSFAQQTSKYLRDMGFSDEEITSTTSHRAFLIADKARQFDELMKAKETAPLKKAPIQPQKTLKPKAAEAPRAPKKPGPGSSDDDRRAWVLSQLDAE